MNFPHSCDRPHKAQALALGIPPEMLERRELDNFYFDRGGVIAPMRMESTWADEVDTDSDEVADAKSFARAAESKYMAYFKTAAGQVNRIDKDLRFSQQGKMDAISDVYRTFKSRVAAEQTISELSAQFSAMYAAALNVQQPEALRPSDAVGAIADMEYRRILAARQPAERLEMLTRLALNSPNSQMLGAALRVGPEVVDLTIEQIRPIRGLFAANAKPRELAAIWQASSGLVFVHTLLESGNAALSSIAGVPGTLAAIPAAGWLAGELSAILEPFGAFNG